MGRETNISWTHSTFSPWRGCQHATFPDGITISESCRWCYAEAMSRRNPKMLGVWGPNGTRVCAAPAYWRQPLGWNAIAEGFGERRRVFCASISDVFEDWAGPILDHHEQRLYRTADGLTNEKFRGTGERRQAASMADLRRMLFGLIDATPWLDWLLLTKRPENIGRMWPTEDDGADGKLTEAIFGKPGKLIRRRNNVWLGTSISDQATADEWIPRLLKCRNLASVLFVSVEPLLGPIDFIGPAYLVDCPETAEYNLAHYGSSQPLDQIIVGGESGPHRRPMQVEWMQDIADQCDVCGVSLFVKQDSAASPGEQGRIPDKLWARKEFPVVVEAVR